jgi:hypothetical protein
MDCHVEYQVDQSIHGIIILIFSHVCEDCNHRNREQRKAIQQRVGAANPGKTVTTVEHYYKRGRV